MQTLIPYPQGIAVCKIIFNFFFSKIGECTVTKFCFWVFITFTNFQVKLSPTVTYRHTGSVCRCGVRALWSVRRTRGDVRRRMALEEGGEGEREKRRKRHE